MCTSKTVPVAWTTLYSDVTDGDGVFIPVTGWMDAAQVKKFRSTFEVAATTDASGVIKPGAQFADSPDPAGTPLAPAGIVAKTGNGTSYPTSFSDVSVTAAQKQLVRFGYWFKASAAGLKAARISGKIEVEG